MLSEEKITQPSSPLLMVGAIIAVMLALGLAIYFFATRTVRPPAADVPLAPLIDPALSSRVKADTEATNRAYAKFKAQYTPEQIKKIQQNLLQAAQQLKKGSPNQ